MAMTNKLDGTLQVLRIMSIAMTMGLVTATVVFIAVVGNKPPLPGEEGLPIPMVGLILGILSLCFLVMGLVIPFVLPTLTINQLVANGPPTEDAIRSLITGHRVIRLAVIEGAGFMGAIGYFLVHHPVMLLPVGAAVAVMILQFPTRAGLQREHDRLQALANLTA
jgi:hypothetical protein